MAEKAKDSTPAAVKASESKRAAVKADEGGVPVNLTTKPDRYKDGVPVAVKSGPVAAPTKEK